MRKRFVILSAVESESPTVTNADLGLAKTRNCPTNFVGPPPSFLLRKKRRGISGIIIMPQLHSELCTLHSAQRFQRCAKKYCACNKIFSILNFEFNGNLDSRALQKPKYGRCKTCIVIPTVSRFDSGWCAFNNSFFAPTFIHRRFF